MSWVHLGDGPERARVEAAARALPSNVAWELKGWVDNRAVLDFYATHRVDALLSLSTSEGIPVSMMEAQSFGIPIVAAAVGGIPELVTPKTGLLLRPGSSPAVIASALLDAVQEQAFSADDIRAQFAKRYDARATYQSFADSLIGIWTQARGAT